jgi:hypothetical protein
LKTKGGTFMFAVQRKALANRVRFCVQQGTTVTSAPNGPRVYSRRTYTKSEQIKTSGISSTRKTWKPIQIHYLPESPSTSLMIRTRMRAKVNKIRLFSIVARNKFRFLKFDTKDARNSSIHLIRKMLKVLSEL